MVARGHLLGYVTHGSYILVALDVEWIQASRLVVVVLPFFAVSSRGGMLQ